MNHKHFLLVLNDISSSLPRFIILVLRGQIAFFSFVLGPQHKRSGLAMRDYFNTEVALANHIHIPIACKCF